MSEPLLAGRALSRRYGDFEALAPIELELEEGESIALVGPNGAGKSTLLSLLAGALPASGGAVAAAARARIGWLPQRPAHYARLSARENLELFSKLEGEPAPAERASELIERLQLPADRPSGKLSVGNRQRLNVAIALLGRPNVLLLDEPTAALDPDQRGRLWEEFEGWRAEGGALLFSTQHLEEVERHAERVLVLRDGKLEFAGDRAQFASWEPER